MTIEEAKIIIKYLFELRQEGWNESIQNFLEHQMSKLRVENDLVEWWIGELSN